MEVSSNENILPTQAEHFISTFLSFLYRVIIVSKLTPNMDDFSASEPSTDAQNYLNNNKTSELKCWFKTYQDIHGLNKVLSSKFKEG